MSNFEEGASELGRLDGPNILDGDTLFALLASSGIAELSSGDALTTVYVDSTPKDEGELYVNPDGRTVHGFMTKFSPDFTGWGQGDLVRARFVINPKADQVSLLVADSFVGDIRHADEFVLEGDQAELAKLRGLGITELDLDVEVTSEEREYIVSNMFKYSARVDRINNILTAWDGKSELTPGQVLLQGEVTEYIADERGAPDNKKPTHMTLDVNGESVVINMNAGHVRYEGGPYEKLLSDVPEIGDVVQVLAHYNPDFKQQPHYRPRVSAFDASWCRSTYCLAVNAERAAEQEAFSVALDNAIDELATITEHPRFRQQYGRIIEQSLVDSAGKDCRSRAQQERMAKLVEAIFPEDQHLRKPLLAIGKDFPSVYATFKESYGIDIYSMSVSEVCAVVMGIAQDPSKLDPKTRETDYLFRVVNDALSPEQMSTLATTILSTYYPITVRKDASYDKDYTPEHGKVPYCQRSLTEAAISHLGSTGLERDIETLTALFESSIANDQFSQIRRENDYMTAITNSLHHALCETGTWSADKGWHGVTDIDVLQRFQQVVIPRLTAAMGIYTAKVNALPYVNDEKYAAFNHSFTLDHLQKMVELASELEALAA